MIKLISFFLSMAAAKEAKALSDKPEKQIEFLSEFYSNAVNKVEYRAALNDALKRIKENKQRYLKAEKICEIPWQMIAAVHYREAHCRFDRQLLNGQKVCKKTTLVPKGLGPWESWEHSCKDAFAHVKKPKNLQGWLDWAEKHNGLGYRNRGLFSPYMYAGTTFYQKGLYVADGKFNEEKIDKRVGVIPILKGLNFSDSIKN